MKTVIAIKAIGRTAPGGTTKLPANQARALVALGHAAYAPDPVKRKARTYQRRDMVAEPVVAEPAAKRAIYQPSVRAYEPTTVYKKPTDGKA